MTELVIAHISWGASHAALWGFLIIFVLMAVESSFIPFPSEVVMIPAGFLAVRGELSTAMPIPDLLIAIACGLAGSMLGAYINYYLAFYLGRPVLYRYGKYFFLPENALKRSEELFLEYGDISTFVCRLLPGIRQLISLPAGFVKMPLWPFTLFTALGAGIWTGILAGIGYYLGSISKKMSYPELVYKGKDLINEHYPYLILILLVIVSTYIFVHHKIMKSKRENNTEIG
jgi:membrane protein DedA with SNARE-associated domain